ncbi:hypothetical protein HMPREF0724_11683 [Prescottella equi ATCC 33707]|uniref:Uncharacterized protein n=1 Tax=Prescottella equi ATCC 33707 TaxID=525370 RepID=E9SZY2_RHOHA|nr:hypothetical protein HMPREF0724_11683 [Prescottella equi ATCC 33707]
MVGETEKAPGSRDLGAFLVGITRGSRRSESSIDIVPGDTPR